MMCKFTLLASEEGGEEIDREVMLNIPGCMRVSDVVQDKDNLYRITVLTRKGNSCTGTITFHKKARRK